MITIEQLVKLFPQTKRAQLEKYVAPLNATFEKFHINQPLRIRAFLAQVGHECAEFNTFTENLNYSEQALLKVFKKYFNTTTAKKYARKPEKIANRVYANRMGNGDEASGDGWRYRGRGGIQLTGANNYKAFAHFMGLKLEDAIALLDTPEGHMMASGWFWAANNLNGLADAQDMLTLTRRINGGTNGLEHRMLLWNRSKSIFPS